MGVDAKLIDILSVGESESSDRGDDQSDRRVEVTVVK